MLKIENLTCRAADRQVFQGLSLNAAENEILGITGAPGCGKSLLLSVIAGKHSAYSGNITIFNTDLRTMKSGYISRAVSHYTPFKTGFNPDSTLYDSIMKGRRLHKNIFTPYSLSDRELTEKYMEQLELNEYSGEKNKNLPASIFHAGAIAHNINMECGLVLMDSPDTALNYRQRVLVSRMLKKYTSSGERSVIIASGSIDFLVQSCDRIVVLRGGIVAESGSHEMIDDEFMRRCFNVNAIVTRNIVTGLPEIHIVENA